MTQPKYRPGDVIRSDHGRSYRVASVGRDGIYELVDVLSRARSIEAVAYADEYWPLVSDEEAE